MKKIIITIIIILVILALSILIIPIIKNNNYRVALLNNIYENTDIQEINYINKDNNYYIIKTIEKVIVLDLNYEEKYTLETSKLHNRDLELVYRRNNLYFEEKKKEKEKIIYKFYNVETGILEYETSLGGN